MTGRTVNGLQSQAERHWAKRDTLLHRLSRATPLPSDTVAGAPDPFAALAQAIIHQQVSVAAGRTIHARLMKLLGGKVTPRRVLNRNAEQLRAAGLSRGKASYIVDLAEKTSSGAVELDRFDAMADGDIVRELTAVKGIGVWTAKMFLLHPLCRPDVLPHEDLGLRLAVARVYGVAMDAAAELMQAKRALWSPYCSVASRVLWYSLRSTTA